MKSISGYSHSRGGFSAIELLATIVIIGILLSFLVPALNTVQKIAGKVRQKSQFGSIEVALEAYRNDMAEYPDSSWFAGDDYCGAQKLAEAMVGLDGFGYHPDSLMDGDWLVYDRTDPANIAARKGSYLELETANAVKLEDIYPSGAGGLQVDTFILADTFKNVKNLATGKKTGMPILYFRADSAGMYHRYQPRSMAPADMVPIIYDFFDNSPLIGQNAPFDGTVHTMATDSGQSFMRATTNPNYGAYDPSVPGPDPNLRPYRTESYILFSAGPDGYYGTADDIYNFDADN